MKFLNIWNEEESFQNSWDIAKAVLRRKLTSTISIFDRSQTYDLDFHLKKQGAEDQFEAKGSRRKEILKIRKQ